MKIKKILGLCERKGCKNRANEVITAYNRKKKKVITLQLCEDCSWELYSNYFEMLGENKWKT